MPEAVGPPRGLRNATCTGGYQCLITAGAGGHCCPRTRRVTTQLPMQGLGHSPPHGQPRDEAASSVGTSISSHHPASAITQRQPTEHLCQLQVSHLQAALEALEDPGLLLCPETRRMLSSVVTASRHRGPRVGRDFARTIPVCLGHLNGVHGASGQSPASKKRDQGSGIHAVNAIVAHGIYRRALYIRRGQWQRERSKPGMQGTQRALPGSRERLVDQGDLAGPEGGETHHSSTLQPQLLPSPQFSSLMPAAKISHIPIPSPAKATGSVLLQGGWGCPGQQQTALTLGPAFPGNPGGPWVPISPCWEARKISFLP